MIKQRLILCGGVTADEQLRNGRHIVSLATRGPHKNVNIQVQDVARVFGQNLPSRLQDLLEIVTYLYSADCVTDRGVKGKWGDEDSLEPWQRDFRIVIPVRNPEFWSSSVISQTLRDTLQFLSDANGMFASQPLRIRQPFRTSLNSLTMIIGRFRELTVSPCFLAAWIR